MSQNISKKVKISTIANNMTSLKNQDLQKEIGNKPMNLSGPARGTKLLSSQTIDSSKTKPKASLKKPSSRNNSYFNRNFRPQSSTITINQLKAYLRRNYLHLPLVRPLDSNQSDKTTPSSIQVS
jgi:hypothetical protein